MNVGVVGVGWAGQQHLKGYAALPGVTIAAVAGFEDAPRDALAAQYGAAHSVARWEDLLAVEGLDAVSVCVPTFLHAPITLAALERGLHVLCEKPLALDGDEAATMVAAARAAGRVLDVAFNHRRRRDVRRLRAEIEAGRLGRIYYARAWWLRRRGIPTIGSWFTRRELAGGGPLVDIGVHVLDYALYLLGDPGVRAVSAATYDLLGRAGYGSAPDEAKSGGDGVFDVEDFAAAFVRLGDGGALQVETNWAAHRAEGDQFGATLYGTEGGAEWTVDDYSPTGTVRLFGDDAGRATVTRLRPGSGGGHDEVVAEFVAAIRSGAWAGRDGAAAARLARTVDACYRSAAEGREVRL